MQSLRVTRFPTAGDDPSFSLIRPSVRTGAPSPAGGRSGGDGGARGPHPALRATYPPCGARKMLQAYAFLCIFRPLRKRSPRFIRPWRREDSFPPCEEKAFAGRPLSVALRHLSPTRGEASGAKSGFPVCGEGFCRAVPLRRFATPLLDAGRGKRCETGIPRARGETRATLMTQ